MIKNMKRGSLVTKIGDGLKTPLKVKGYAILDTNWITEHDKVLIDKDGTIYNVLDLIEIEENTLVCDMSPYNSGWQIMMKSCVKLDKYINEGNILYIL